MPLFLNPILGIAFYILFGAVTISMFLAAICYFLADYLHYKFFGKVLFQTQNVRNPVLDISYLKDEYNSITTGQKAKGHAMYRVSFILYYFCIRIIRYATIPLIITTILLFTIS